MEFEENEIVLIDEEGEEIHFNLIDAVMVDNRKYALLEPVDPSDEEEGYTYLFRVEEEDGEEVLIEVEDDEEMEKVIEFLSEFEADEDDNEDLF